jgi:hypothetical protein
MMKVSLNVLSQSGLASEEQRFLLLLQEQEEEGTSDDFGFWFFLPSLR